MTGVQTCALRSLDCRQELADNNRWNNRLVSDSGDWSGNVLDFWGRASRMLTEGLPVPFRLGPDMRRIDDTPQHRAVREALINNISNRLYCNIHHTISNV